MANNEKENQKHKNENEPLAKPNIIVILADDLGFSDVGCFGSEISTPNIDSLAFGSCHLFPEKNDRCSRESKDDKCSDNRASISAVSTKGIRFSQMYNCARCCPSRASLLTGMYPHQAGIGHMVGNAEAGDEYQGYLKKEILTLAEMLKGKKHPDRMGRQNNKQFDEVASSDPGEADQGEADQEANYATFMTGKWHVGGEYPPDATYSWIQSTMGDETHPIPTQCGFDQFYGTLGGGGSYYRPPSLVRNQTVVRLDDELNQINNKKESKETNKEFYYTDAINDEACQMIKMACRANEEKKVKQPFFLYVAHCAPHWPLHAPKHEIDKYRNKYKEGWDHLRHQRHARLQCQKLISSQWQCSPRDDHAIQWDQNVPDPQWEDARMATYAAQITVMDQGIGRILATLHDHDIYDNTLIFFLSDNGGCAEYLKENGECGHWPEYYGGVTRDGNPIQVGNVPTLEPGGEETFMSYDLPWANASNAPFRLFKSFVHEGGISTPFIVHWPLMMRRKISDSEDASHNSDASNYPILDCNRICHTPWILMDIVATCCEVAGITPPIDLEGESFLSILKGDLNMVRKRPIFWEHQGNCAVRDGPWKLVYRRRSCGTVVEEPVGDSDETLNDTSCDTPSHALDKRRENQFSDSDSQQSSSLCSSHSNTQTNNISSLCKKNPHGDNIVHHGWELYNMEHDRTELHDLSSQLKERVQNMIGLWKEWAERCGVKQWPLHPIPEGEKDWSNLPWMW